jgi:hypothetical protein
MDVETKTTSRNPNLEEARQHFKEAHESLRESYKALIPAGYREQRRKARKEFLYGLRKLLDAAIERTENKSTTEK